MKTCKVIILTVMFITSGGFAMNEVNAQKTASTITTATLIKQLIDMDQLAQFPNPAYKMIQFSSYDRSSTAPYAPGWFANSDGFGNEPIPNFLEVLKQPDKNGIGIYLLAQVDGPGAIVRTWTAAFKGEVSVYLDGNPKPLYQGDAEQFFRDKYKYFTEMSGLPEKASESFDQRNACYFPIAFAKKLRIEFKGNLKELHFYHIQTKLYPAGTNVRTFSLQDIVMYKNDITQSLSVLSSKGDTWKTESAGNNQTFNTQIQSGQETELFSLKGPKAIQLLTLKVKAGNIQKALRQIILRGYFDDASSPQIESPIGDFFGSAPGIASYSSLPMHVAEDGTMTCRFLMPFKSSAKFVIENFSSEPAEVTSNISITDYEWKDDSSLYFFAKWRIDNNLVTKPVFDVPFLVARGKGLYVGTAIMLYNSSPIPSGIGAWWGEGDEKIWTDDDVFPSIFGTGSEDYFNYAWGTSDIFTSAYCAQTLSGPDGRGFVANNRFHIADPILFEKHIDFYMELYHHSKTAEFSYARIAYFYAANNLRDDVIPITAADVTQGIEHIPWQPLAQKGSKDAIFYQAEDIVDLTNPNVKIVDAPACAGGKLVVWSPESPGQTLKFKINVEKTENYKIIATAALTTDSGQFKLSIDDKEVKPTINLYTPHRFEMLRNVYFAGAETNKTLKLTQGQHVFSLIAEPKDKESKGSDIGIDFFWLVPVQSKMSSNTEAIKDFLEI